MTRDRAFSALIFDFDGVVVETEAPEFLAWREVFEEHGASLGLDEWSVAIGTVGALDPLALLAGRAPAGLDGVAASASYGHRYRELLAATTVQPGVVDVLDAAASLGLGVAIASSSPSWWITAHLERLGLAARFDVIAGFDTVGVAKPAPDAYLAAARRLGVVPHEAVAFEDSRNGLLAAKAARLTCVAVPTAMTRHLDLSEADLVVDSLAAMPLGVLLEHLAAS